MPIISPQCDQVKTCFVRSFDILWLLVYVIFIEDMFGCAVGPVPPQTFLNRFLPRKSASNRRLRKDTFKTIQSHHNGVYKSLVSYSQFTVKAITDLFI